MKPDHKERFNLREAERRIANMIMIGTIVTVDEAAATASVQIGELTTAKLPWLSGRMGSRKDWSAPVVGEQVLVVCHNGDPAQGIIVASLGSTANPQPSANPRIFKTVFADGAFVQIDLDTHEMSIGCAGDLSVVADGDLDADCQGSAAVRAAVAARVTAPSIQLKGAVAITGTLSVSGMTALNAATVQGVGLAPGGNQF